MFGVDARYPYIQVNGNSPIIMSYNLSEEPIPNVHVNTTDLMMRSTRMSYVRTKSVGDHTWILWIPHDDTEHVALPTRVGGSERVNSL